MFDRFCNDTKAALDRARDAAFAFNHGVIGPEHILLGLLEDHLAGYVLGRLGTSRQAVQSAIKCQLGPGEQAVTKSSLSYSMAANEVLDNTLEEVVGFGHRDISTGHLLIALAREAGSIAGHVLADLGADVDGLRFEVLESLAEMDAGHQPAA